MPFLSKAFRLGIAVLTKITDAFSRTTTGSLGTTDTGQSWLATRGTWFANGSSAQSNDSASSYPIASVELGSTDASVSASTTEGTGVSFWVTDAGSWWAAQSFVLNTTTTISQCIPYNGFSFSASGQCVSGPSFGAGGCFNSSFISSCSQLYNLYNNDICGGSGINNWSCSGTLQTCYEPCTSTTSNYYLRLLQSNANAVSVPVSDTNIGSAPAALKVTTSGDSISAQAFSNTTLTTTLGSAVNYTPTSPTKGTKHGIIKAPSDNQQSTVDNFSLGQ